MRWPYPLVLFALVACGGPPGVDPDAASLDAGPQDPRDGGADTGVRSPDAGRPECVGDERRVAQIYYGTPEPTVLPLSAGQVLAIGTWGGCSGAFVTDEWVLTARHCGIRVGNDFCVGEDPADPNVCFSVAEVQSHPDVDMTLARMTAPASSRLPQLEPIRIMTERLDASWIGTIAEAAGYGRRQDGTSGIREFTAEPIVTLGDPYVTIDGEGRHGVCFGDSGGPLMVLASDSTVRLLGDLSGGDESCVGRDNFTRTDLVVEWIESHTGPTLIEGGSCGRLTPEGDCAGNTAVWCEDGALRSSRCEGDARCGWDAASSAYRCITGADPCDGLTARGECRGSVAAWCESGVVRTRDCASCGELCAQVADVGGAYCQPDPCAGLDYHGECRGNVAVWCDAGNLRTRDCGSGVCRYIDDRVGYFCATR